MKSLAVSLCISTYNWPEALSLCLQSILQQTILPAEIIIGDDGSTEETKRLIDDFKQQFSIPLIHVWQPDDGFKLAQIRNKTFANARGDYIIQIDGDLVLEKHFIEDHIRFAKTGTFVAGARSLINREATAKFIEWGKIDYSILKTSLGKKYNAVRCLPLAYINHFFTKGPNHAKYVLGANMAFFKQDIEKVNGYNEAFTGWGKEDNDLAIRLCNTGLQLHSLKFAGIIYHLHHNEASRENMTVNETLLQETINNKTTFITEGMSKYKSLYQ